MTNDNQSYRPDVNLEPTAPLTAALTAWRGVLGPEHVVSDPGELAAASRATFATAQRVPAIIRPSTVEEVQEALVVANQYRVAVYPVSTGRNWGFGSRVPPASESVLMELRRMDRIRAYDEELAYVTVEPGVTFRQLHDFLRAQGSALMVPFTGSSPETSLVGNALERGVGSGRHAYRIQHCCGFEIVLPTGELVRSGLAGFPDAAAAPVYRGGPGPEIDGLFVQSNLGVVTAMTIWLGPAPKHLQLCYVSVQQEDRLGELVDVVRGLLVHGLVAPVVTLRNDYFLLMARQQRYPFDALDGETPFPPAVLDRMNDLKGRHAWWSARWCGFIYLEAGSALHAKAQREVVAEAVGDRLDRLVFITDEEVFVRRWEGGVDRDEVARGFEGTRPSRGLLSDPGAGNVSLVYWRKRAPAPPDLDPDRDGCGAIFCTPLVPLRGPDVAGCTGLVAETMLAHGFEPAMSVFAISERCAYIAVMLIFDRDVDGEDDRALACHDAMLQALIERGYVPHRVPIRAMEMLRSVNPAYPVFLDCLKRALDPNGILAPGRYGIGAPEP